jgi:hypothetical protein
MPAANEHEMLLDLFHQHGIGTGESNGWIFPSPTSTAMIAATWYPGEHNGELMIEVRSGQDRMIESFAGIGAGDAGLPNAMMMFMMTNFHVLLAALWDVHDESQVTTRICSIGLQRFDAFTGNIISRMSRGKAPPIPQNMEACLGKAVEGATLSDGTHWFRFFMCNLNGTFTFEALHNNEEWGAGRDALEALAWEKQDGYYSMRMFMMLRPALATDRSNALTLCSTAGR